jgi:hypothetical protein
MVASSRKSVVTAVFLADRVLGNVGTGVYTWREVR